MISLEYRKKFTDTIEAVHTERMIDGTRMKFAVVIRRNWGKLDSCLSMVAKHGQVQTALTRTVGSEFDGMRAGERWVNEQVSDANDRLLMERKTMRERMAMHR